VCLLTHLARSQVEGTDVKQLASLRPKFTKVFVDIGGVVEIPYLEPVLKQLEALRPNLIVVKVFARSN